MYICSLMLVSLKSKKQTALSASFGRTSISDAKQRATSRDWNFYPHHVWYPGSLSRFLHVFFFFFDETWLGDQFLLAKSLAVWMLRLYEAEPNALSRRCFQSRLRCGLELPLVEPVIRLHLHQVYVHQLLSKDLLLESISVLSCQRNVTHEIGGKRIKKVFHCSFAKYQQFVQNFGQISKMLIKTRSLNVHVSALDMFSPLAITFQ